jgi:hypothetical protein
MGRHPCHERGFDCANPSRTARVCTATSKRNELTAELLAERSVCNRTDCLHDGVIVLSVERDVQVPMRGECCEAKRKRFTDDARHGFD